MFVTLCVENSVEEGENTYFSNTIPLFEKTLKMTLHKQRKSTAIDQVEQSKRSFAFSLFP